MNVRRLFPTVLLPLCLSSRILAGPTPTLTLGQNFLGSTYNLNVTSIPPDSNGAIGPRHFAEFLNGSFAVYNKTNGQNIKRISDLHFWSNAGVVLSTDAATTDPRIIYDPSVQRWFASMVDLNQNATDPTLEANDFLFAVSDTSDPTLTWHGFLIQADPDTGYFADFPTLGVDSSAVYLSGDMYHGQTTPVGPALVSFPKADLVAAAPTIANRTWFGVMSYDARGQVLQPAICLDGSVNGKILATTDIGNDSNPHSNLVSSVVRNAGTSSAVMDSAVVIPTATWEVPDNPDYGAPLLTATQPDGTSALMANDARISAKMYAVSGVLYAVHNTEVDNHIAIRWYRIRAADNALLESGTIADPNMDLFFPSISANAFGVIVIGYNGSGPSTPVSCYAIAGQTIAGQTSFGTPLLLQAGATSYHGDDEVVAGLLGTPPFSRWGDYSATSPDPADPNRFWTIQMLPSDSANQDVWSTQITELITTSQILLSLQAGGGNVTISWPAAATGYQLQVASSVATPTAWSNVSQTPQTNASQIYVTLPASASQQFFRLKK